MTVLLALAAVAALGDWLAVERGTRLLEYVTKPAATVLLLAAAAAGGADAWIVGALALCLAGDVFLMLPQDLFVPGLASFLVGHVLFGIGFFAHEPRHNPLVTFAVGAVALLVILPPIMRAVGAREPALRVPVAVYGTTIVAMFGASGATGSWVVIAGAAVFVTSDTILAYNRFARPFAHGRLAVMVTYHAALALLVLGFV